MATIAGVRGVRIVTVVAGIAGCSRVGSEQWEATVIEGRIGPQCWIMALRTIRREASCDVVRVSSTSIVRHMATITRVRCVVVVAVVALIATHCRMRVRERIDRMVVTAR